MVKRQNLELDGPKKGLSLRRPEVRRRSSRESTQGFFSCPTTEQPDTEKPKPELKMQVTFCHKGNEVLGFIRSIPVLFS